MPTRTLNRSASTVGALKGRVDLEAQKDANIKGAKKLSLKRILTSA